MNGSSMQKSFIKILTLFCLLYSLTSKAQANKEIKITEVITLSDSVPSSELLKRAVNWVKIENPKYGKSSGVTTGSKAECVATFSVKPKELNPECDYTGKITMKVIIECKDSKYRYTVNQMKHTSTSGNTSGGELENVVPSCGSMAMSEVIWKKLKGEALKYAGSIASNIKETMKVASDDLGKEDW